MYKIYQTLLLPSILAVSLTSAKAEVPPELESIQFSGPKITPCPACLCAAATGEVFVGVDMLGSLGKGPGKGKIIRLVDTNGDGEADKHTVYANIDNPRGLIAVGTKLYVLHTVIPPNVGKLTGMHLSVLEDKNWDGIADGEPKKLISDISPPKHNQDRGADHTTNGIRMGIDGWIYIAVGDFGIHGAKGTDGTELTMLGGGVLRVRPDGSEMEVYTHGLRNIYDIAIDPFMNIYTRGNTNDGGGWNVRFIHHIQSGEYGYPMLFKNFTDEIIPALADLGGGSGTGAMFLQEPGWPDKYNNIAIMCDWGRSQLIIHRLTPDGPTFTQKPENFIRLHQITDVDTDASGRLYAGAWAGAGYRGSPDKGWVERIVPKGWVYKPFKSAAKRTDQALVNLLLSESSTARLAASQALLQRPKTMNAVASIAANKSAPLHSRVAAIFTYKQMAGPKAGKGLAKLSSDAAIAEWALRAMADRKTQLEGVNKEMLITGLSDKNPRVRVAAAVALGRL
ncbi:MAG: heme-binding protein, partial [Proteobacteria bacterium]|nr:heme-binding protein [Pseudomonadota bacterium]